MNNIIYRPTTMAQAMFDAALSKNSKSIKLVRAVNRAIERNSGLVKERGVNVKVSFRTAQKLKQEGIL